MSSFSLVVLYSLSRFFPATALANSADTMKEFAPPWVSEPKGRGTWSLLYSCTFTLILCVWSAIHLNVAPKGEPAHKQVLRKAKWAVIAIMAPEFVVLTAWQQFHRARVFCAHANRILLSQQTFNTGAHGTANESNFTQINPNNFRSDIVPTEQDEESGQGTYTSQIIGGVSGIQLRGLSTRPDVQDSDQGMLSGDSLRETEASYMSSGDQPKNTPQKFSLLFGFYVVMGGFCIDVSDIYDFVKTVTLTDEGVLRWLRQGRMNGAEIDDVAIRDKSKRDYLGKGLVIMQVTWLFLQCIERKMSGLPLSILEVHTVIHAACALMIFCCWWYKPYDVREATLVSTKRFKNDVAMEIVMHYRSACPPFRSVKPTPGWIGAESEAYYLRCRHNGNVQSQDASQQHSHTIELAGAVHSEGDPENEPIVIRPFIPPGHPLTAPVIKLVTGQALPCGIGPTSSSVGEPRLTIHMFLTDKDQLRLSRCASSKECLHDTALGHHSRYLFLPRMPNTTEDLVADLLAADFERLIRRRRRSEGIRDVLNQAYLSLPIMSSFLLSWLYAGLHLLLWNATFPTPTENLIWRVAGCFLACYPLLTPMLIICAGPLPLFGKLLLQHDFAFGCLIFAILCRMYIVIESFLSLRHVPVGVYSASNWAQYIPHL